MKEESVEIIILGILEGETFGSQSSKSHLLIIEMFGPLVSNYSTITRENMCFV